MPKRFPLFMCVWAVWSACAFGAPEAVLAQRLPADSLAAYGPPTAAPGAFRWSSPAHDRWLGRDKAQHFLASALIATAAQYVLVNKLGVPERRALPVSLVLSAQAGLAKETLDAYRVGGSGFSVRDLVWDGVGIGAAALLVVW